ncbi:hypothetical protein I317_00757 [Kwoniella heveanensis CBS 569]|nr:hypothetical protein I317_00757 [Kwoniella heveanensis CBS 569]
MSPQHTARFTWGAGAQTVCVAGGFNNWSATATPLEKQADGSFAADVPLPWGEKQAFKYVVDGDWKVREDEAKEWDAAGNMNNVYTAPPAPVSSSTAGSSSADAAPASGSTSGPVPTVVPAPAASTSKETSKSEHAHESIPSPAPKEKTLKPTEDDKPPAVPEQDKTITSIPSADTPDTPPPVTSETTQPKTLIASSAPGPALGAPILGGPVFASSKDAPTSTSTSTTTTTTAVVPPSSTSTGASPADVPAAAPAPAAVPAHANQKPLAEEPIAVQIEKVAAKANIGEAPVGPEEPGIADKASEFAAGALAAIGAVVGSAAVAVEKATGVDIAHVGPLSVDEAKARGIDINSLEKVDAETDTTSPVGAGPSASAVNALEEKIQELKVGSSTATGSVAADSVSQNPNTATGVADVPLPKTAEPKTSLPPPGTFEPEKKSVEADPEHDIPAQHETIDNHQHIPQPVITTVSDKDPKKDRTANSTSLNDTAGTKPISHDPAVSAKQEKAKAETDLASVNAASNSPLNEPKVSPDAPAANIPPKPDTQAAAASGADASATPSPAPAAAAAPPTPAPAAPATPAKSAATKTNGAVATPASISSTPASTPAKSTHAREQTTDSDIRKRKSSFFTKIKHAFSPKDKEKK